MVLHVPKTVLLSLARFRLQFMTGKTKKLLCGALAALAIAIALDAVYLLGYRHGGRGSRNR